MAIKTIEMCARDIRANVGILFGVSLVPILLFAGFALDSARVLNTKQRLQVAVDMAALAGAREFESTAAKSEEIIAVAKYSFDQNVGAMPADIDCSDADISVEMTSQKVKVSATCSYPTFTGGGLFGSSDRSVVNSSTAQADYTTLELALALDLSDSMSGEKLASLQVAAKRLIDTLITDASGDRVRIALVPYTHAVNAGIYGNRAAGLPDSEPGIDGEEQVCPAERSGAEALTDARPQVGAWVNAPSGFTIFCGTGSNAHHGRLGHTLMPLTKNSDSLKSEIDSFRAVSQTGGHLAVAWAWYALSPYWDNIWPSESSPAAYGTSGLVKAVVLMTDGEFNAMIHPSYGLGTSSSDHAKLLCTAIKDAGIIIYAIAFKAPTVGEDVMRHCASSDVHYFDAESDDDLIDAFEDIASKFSGGRIIL